jgi:hypothetical protein
MAMGRLDRLRPINRTHREENMIGVEKYIWQQQGQGDSVKQLHLHLIVQMSIAVAAQYSVEDIANWDVLNWKQEDVTFALMPGSAVTS